ncbi:class I SAM-dependent methyltransferase [Streptomyces hygroscopicus]|uniref:class I SAM-dependent methyltransferase n=1 Tax=Streptomyces hygroscopicus TaxID=1912 RepID=UPI00099FAB53|nr:class I SAM-dependent methyltransferase [Streptomyces hygroscopicus]
MTPAGTPPPAPPSAPHHAERLCGEELSAAFDHAARGYDRLVAVNPGYHAQLRRSARRLRLPGAGAKLRLLDLGCGTGASTAALLRAAPLAAITAVDASAGMLARARARGWPPNVRFVHAPVERIAEAADGGRYDAAFAAYLFRNLRDPDAVLAAVRDLLRSGGRLAVHEYTLSGRPSARLVWQLVHRAVVLPLGTLMGDRALYRHLGNSVARFDTVDAFAARMRRAGFDRVRTAPMPGWQTGIVHTVVGRAPGGAEHRRARGGTPG